MKLEHFLNTSPNTFTPNESIKRFSLGNNELLHVLTGEGVSLFPVQTL